METTAAHTPSLAAGLRGHGFTGRLDLPGDPDYDRARACFNGEVDRRPAAVAHALDAEDVAAAIRFCRTAGLDLTVRGGGHSIAGRSLRDDALCIDLRALCEVEVDPATRRVLVGGGALLGELDAATQEHGLAVPAGQISHTGVGGLTLGGGVGWLMRNHGLTVDSLRAAEVVLADGELVRASDDEHQDLFWALRGGGGDFGVVTRFEFEAPPVGPIVLGGMLAYPWEQAMDAFTATRQMMEGAPPELTAFCVMLTAPPQEPFPVELRGERVGVVALAWSGEDLERGERVIAPLREARPAALDLVGPMPYVALQSMLDETAPKGWRFYDKLHYLDEVGDEFLETAMAGFEQAPTPESHVMTAWMGGAIDEVGVGETAFGHRGARALTWIIGCSGERPVDEARTWVRDTWKQTERFASDGVYVNALDEGRPARDAYAEDVWKRLVEVKRRYDPDGVLSASGIG
jgi:FAD/FMN-containing dehydrogenase